MAAQKLEQERVLFENTKRRLEEEHKVKMEALKAQATRDTELREKQRP